MALKSRLELEVDGRSAEQQVIAVRVALDALTQAGLRTGPALSGVFGTISSSVSSINAATNSLKAAQSALSGLSTAGSKAGQSLSGAASSMSTTGANAAAAEARLAAATRAMNELNQSSLRATASLNGVGGSVTVTTRNAAAGVGGLNSNMSSLRSTALSLAGPLLGLFAGGALTKSIYDASEAYSSLTNRMKLVTSGAGELAAAQQAVFDIAQGARQPLTATAELYQRIATNQKELNLSGEGVAGIVSTISKTLAVSGASAASANAALIQLGQAFASGVLRGEELNSVMEQAPALAQAIAAGMGKTVGELRTLGAAGLLTAEAVVKALQDQEKAVDDLFNKTSTTIGASTTALSNSFTQLIGKLDQASGTSASISASLLGVSKDMDGLTSSGITMQQTLDSVGSTMTVLAAGGMTYVIAKMALGAKATMESVVAYYANRSAAIASAEATLNQANADAIRARTAALAAQADAVLYRGTVLQTVAAGRYAEARLAQAAADNIARTAAAGLASAQGGLLGVLGGPFGLALLVASVTAGYVLFRGSADDATKSLIDQNLTLDDTIEKFKGLSAEQQRYQQINWAKEQKESSEAAANALEDFRRTGSEAFLQIGYNANGYRQTFNDMVAEVRDGRRSLDSVTQWAKENTELTDEQVAKLAEAASAYSTNSDLAKVLSDRLNVASGASDGLTKSTSALTAAQAGTTGQTKAQLAEWEKYIAKLTEARDLLGANEKAEAKYRAAKMGLTAEQAKQAEVVATQIDTLKKYQDAIKENDKVQQAALKAQLIALYTQQQAAEDAAAAVKKSHDDAAKAAKESADKQLEQMNRVVTAAKNLVFPGSTRQDLGGYGLLTNGGTPPVEAPKSRKTPQQLTADAIAQLEASTDINKNALKPKTVREDAGQKLLDDARQRYAVLQQQSREIELQGTSTRTLGAEAKKLIELETEISNLKTKGTLTTTQKQVLAMAELNLAQQKQNAALEKANELTKERYETEAKLRAFRENLQSQLSTAREGQAVELEGYGQGDKLRQRLQEDLKIRQEYQRELDKVTRDYNRISNPTASDTALYQGQTEALRSALSTRLSDQQAYYAQVDKLQSDWTVGATQAMNTYAEQAADVASQTRNLFSSAFGNMEDAVVNFVKTGKLSFKDFADQVVADLIRIQVRQAAAGFLNMAIGAGISAFGGGAGAASSAFAPGSAGAISSKLGASAAGYSAKYGFSEGGYTGPGGINEPAGIVHKGEVVWSQDDVRRFGGVQAVEGLRTGNVLPTGGGKTTTSSQAAGASTGAQSGGLVIKQEITVQGAADEATLARIQQAAQKGAQDGYNLVLRDFKQNGPARQLIARR